MGFPFQTFHLYICPYTELLTFKWLYHHLYRTVDPVIEISEYRFSSIIFRLRIVRIRYTFKTNNPAGGACK